jgi:uncharacterized protein (TIRG00374 family)
MAVEARADDVTPAARRRGPAATALLWAGALVACAFGYFAVRDVRPADVWAAVREADARWLVPALAAMTAAFFLRAARWWSLFDDRPPFGAVVRALFVGYLANNLLPLRAGEIARVAALRLRTGRPVAEIAGTVVIERFFDVLSLLALLFLVAPWLPDVTWLRAAGVLALFLSLVLAGAVVALARWGTRPLDAVVWALERMPLLRRARLRAVPAELVAGLAGLRRLRTGAVAFGWTTLSWVVLGIGFWLVTLAFDLDVPPLAGLLVVIAVGLAMILPSPPAALGVFEGATVVAVQAYDVPHADALSFALVLHALNFLPFVAIAAAGAAVRFGVGYRRRT